MSSNSFLSIFWQYWIILLGALVFADDSLTLPRMRRTLDPGDPYYNGEYVPAPAYTGNHSPKYKKLWTYADLLHRSPLDRRSLIYSPQGKDSFLRVLRSYNQMIKKLEETNEENLALKQNDKKWRIRLG